MKKLLILAAFILLLAGCSGEKTNYTTTITNGNQTVATVGNATITKQDLYEHLMDTSGIDYILNQALTQIASTAELDQEAIDAEVASTESTWKAILGESLDVYTQTSFGYDTFEEYKNEILIPSVRQVLMVENYAVENYETLAKKYMFVKARQIIVNDQATGMNVISEITSGETTFEDALEKYSTDSTNKTNKGEIGLISDLSSCTADQSIVAILPQLTISAMYSVPVELSTGKFAVLEIQETDIAAMKDEVLAELQASDEVIYEAEAYFLEQNSFVIVDEYLKQQMQMLYPDYVK